MVIEFTEINMVYRKIKYKVISICFCILLTLSLFFLHSGKKETKGPIGVKIHAVMAHNGQPILTELEKFDIRFKE